MRRLLPVLMCVVVMSGCVSWKQRVVTGRLVQPKTHAPIARQGVALDRPGGVYVYFTGMLFGIPQPVAIAMTTTDGEGYFRFATRVDCGRDLWVRLSGKTHGDFHSKAGYEVTGLQDSYKSPPAVYFDSHLIHDGKGGFRAVP